MNDEDYPPVEYPAREVFTMGFAANPRRLDSMGIDQVMEFMPSVTRSACAAPSPITDGNCRK